MRRCVDINMVRQSIWFASDLGNRRKLRVNSYDYITSYLSFMLKSQELHISVIHFIGLFTVSFKPTTGPMKLLCSDDIRTQWNCLWGQSCSVDWFLIHIFMWIPQSDVYQMADVTPLNWFYQKPFPLPYRWYYDQVHVAIIKLSNEVLVSISSSLSVFLTSDSLTLYTLSSHMNLARWPNSPIMSRY